MTKQQLQPKLRFPEFKGDWEIKYVDDVCSMQAGKFIQASEIDEIQKENLFPCYGGNGLRGFVSSFNHNGTYSLIGRQGALCGNITLAKNKFYATEHAIVVNVNGNIDTIWMYYLLNIMNLNKYATGQAQPGLSVQNIKQLEIVVSNSKEEQTKIATFLSAVDEKLNLLKEKKQALEDYKKGMMQKIFSQEIRFKDDNGNDFADWEEKTLGEICQVITKGTTPKKFVESGIKFIKTECFEGSNINISKCLFIDNIIHENELKRSILKENDILFAIAGSIGKVNIITKEILPANTNQALAIIRLKKNENHSYIFQILKSDVMQKYITESVSVGAQPNLNLEQMNSFPFLYPSLTEQSKIANFLSAIDEKINLVAEALEATNEYKKGLLQQLFV